MPFLRRRGNAASEVDMRRRNLAAAPGTSTLPEDESPRPSQGEASVRSRPSLQVGSPGGGQADGTEDGRLSHQQSRASTASRPDTPPIQEANSRHKRFSVLRFRNASDSQLSLRAKQQAEKPPPVPRRELPLGSPGVLTLTPTLRKADMFPLAPEIITTAPTNDLVGPSKKASRPTLAAKLRLSSDQPRNENGSGRPPVRRARRSFANEREPSLSEEPMPLALPSRLTGISNDSTLQASSQRQSESSRSDESSMDHESNQSPTATPRKSPFFRLRRQKKVPEPLFPMAHLPQKDKTPPANSSSNSLGVSTTPRPATAQSSNTPRASATNANGQRPNPNPTQSPAAALFGSSGAPSGHSSPTRNGLLRGRSSTMSSANRDSTDDHLLPPTTRTSSSTGRKSFGDLFTLSRRRQNSELSRQGTLTPATPGSVGSKNNSFQLPREALPLPERQDDESAAKYLARVEEVTSRGIIAAMLSKKADTFSASVLRSYMRSFSFFGDPMDMAIRKLLMEAELPKETQQIDRFLQAFANRYHECNPGIYSSPDQAYFIAFSILILHTDVFNKNNKYKMQKPDYLKNTGGEGIFDDILECFYDNISYTPFIHVEDEMDLSTERLTSTKSKRKPILATPGNDMAKRAAKEPIDPYTLILEGDLDILRPNLKEAMELEDHFNYLGTAKSLNLKELQNTFFRTGVLQIVSARSRPDAFMSDKTASNPEDAHPGIVDIKVTKVGVLWRKDVKKRKARSPWQEWGAILTGAQLYLFRNTSWVKNLMHQHESHQKAGNEGIPVIFHPPLEEFKPDALMSTQGAVALLDTTYKKHKNAFVYCRPGGFNEILLADDEDEMNDWLAKLNYAAAFRTTGVKMRGAGGQGFDGQGQRAIRRHDASDSTQLVDTPSGPVAIARGHIDHKMVEDIQSARRETLQRKIEEADKKLEESQKQLDEQLRNARHLQILAPIQPRSRDQLLTAAGRMAAQLKWTRMEIWKEMCHRDIMAQDLAEDLPLSEAADAVSKQQLAAEAAPTRPRGKSQSRRPSIIGSDKQRERKLSNVSIPPEIIKAMEAPLSPPLTRPRGASHTRHLSHDLPSRSDASSMRQGSVSSLPGSPSLSSEASHARRESIQHGEEHLAPRARQADDVDAEERDFLHQVGLLEARSGRDTTEKEISATSVEVDGSLVHGDRDKADKNKIRRSLHRTLRDGAGHLSHHRSKRGRELGTSGTSDDTSQDRSSMLSRGTGSFVVHGKKASVIEFGSELQILSQEDKLRGRKLTVQGDVPLSPHSNGDDEDFHSALGDVNEAPETPERRESTASASTATARSFRELHRKWSSAQAARSVSAVGRLAIPSDADSEAAVSFSEGRRSPNPQVSTEEPVVESEVEGERAGHSAHKGKAVAGFDDSSDEESERGEDEAEGEPASDMERITSRPVEAVHA